MSDLDLDELERLLAASEAGIVREPWDAATLRMMFGHGIQPADEDLELLVAAVNALPELLAVARQAKPSSRTELVDDAYRLTLPLLLERFGGVVEVTEVEHQAFVERHGGIRHVAVQVERTESGLRLTIVHKEPPVVS